MRRKLLIKNLVGGMPRLKLAHKLRPFLEKQSKEFFQMLDGLVFRSP